MNKMSYRIRSIHYTQCNNCKGFVCDLFLFLSVCNFIIIAYTDAICLYLINRCPLIDNERYYLVRSHG